MRHRKTRRKQAGAVTRVGAGKQASLFSRTAVRAITLTRRQQIEARLEQARESRDPDSFWALWFERERLRCQDAAGTAQEPQREAEAEE